MFIGLFSSMFMYLGMLTRSLDFVIYLLGMPETYLNFIIGPFYNLVLIIKSFDLFELFMSIFNSIMYISAFITCYKMIKGKPFVKCAGGKRQILDKLKQFVPEEFKSC